METPSGRHATVDAAALKLSPAAGSEPESWAGVSRGAICSGCAVAIAWHTPGVSSYALGVILLVASPALARAFAPLLQHIVKR